MPSYSQPVPIFNSGVHRKKQNRGAPRLFVDRVYLLWDYNGKHPDDDVGAGRSNIFHIDTSRDVPQVSHFYVALGYISGGRIS